jgi:processive 1,2-diacylglycerol beta-glucosyltransferase
MASVLVSDRPKLLILTASYGSGHNSAAHALHTASQRAGLRARIVDHFRELVDPRFDRWTRAVYNLVIRRARPLWGLAYWLGDQMTPSSRLEFGMGVLGTRGLERLLQEEQPDFVISTHPTPAGALSNLRLWRRTTVPHALVFTDFTAHSQWVHRVVDRYCVPAPTIGEELAARGVPSEHIVATGIPLRPEFDQPIDRAAAREALDLSPKLPFVLVMAGALGSAGRISAATHVLRELPFPVQGAVMAGTEGWLARRLSAVVEPTAGRIRILPFSKSVRTLMVAADILITKAGGVSVAEALAAHVPTICFGSLPGQESRNEAFVVGTGAALRARSAIELREILCSTLTDPRLLVKLRERAREVSRPNASHAVLDCVLGLGCLR